MTKRKTRAEAVRAWAISSDGSLDVNTTNKLGVVAKERADRMGYVAYRLVRVRVIRESDYRKLLKFQHPQPQKPSTRKRR